MSEIVFHAAVHQVKTLADNGLIISFELPETEVMQAAQFMECKRQGIYLKVTCETAKQSRKTIMPFKKGQSGNPNGRPKKRAMSEILAKEMWKPQAKGLLGLYRRGISTGKVQFPGEEKPSVLSLRDWMMLVEFIYKQTDGPPSADVELTGDVKILVDYANDPYQIRPTPSGADEGNSEPQEV